MRKVIALVFIFLSVACTKNTDDALNEEELISNFELHQDIYVKMKKMITKDARNLDRFIVGGDRIGEYRLHEKGWYKNYGEYVPYDIVLGLYLLNDSRIKEYRRLLASTDTQDVGFYNGSVAITVLANGFLFGGCLSQIYYEPIKIELERPSWANVYYSASFSEHWAGETKCN